MLPIGSHTVQEFIFRQLGLPATPSGSRLVIVCVLVIVLWGQKDHLRVSQDLVCWRQASSLGSLD